MGKYLKPFSKFIILLSPRLWVRISLAIISAGVGVYILISLSSSPYIPETQLIREQKTTILSTEGPFPRTNVMLEWMQFPKAARYEVAISDSKGMVLWRGETNTNILILPVEAILERKKEYRWDVKAYSSAGEVIGLSGKAQLRVEG